MPLHFYAYLCADTKKIIKNRGFTNKKQDVIMNLQTNKVKLTKNKIVEEMLVMMYVSEDLRKETVKNLLVIAKELQIVGRHDMRKEQLVEAIVKASKLSTSVVEITSRQHDVEHDLITENTKRVWGDEKCEIVNLPKQKSQYIDNAKIGMIVAFKVNETKVLSGMIEEIHKTDFLVKTKNGVRFTVRKKNILWVKTKRWPKGIYLALKGEAPVNNVKYKATY